MITGLTVFYENSEKITHYYLEYDLEKPGFVGRKFNFNTRDLESEKCRFEKIKSKFGQENGFSLYIRRISTDEKQKTSIFVRKASKSAVLQAIDGNSVVADTERHNVIEVLLKPWTDTGISINLVKISNGVKESLGPVIFTAYHPKSIEKQQISNQNDDMEINTQQNPPTQTDMIDNSQQTQEIVPEDSQQHEQQNLEKPILN